jgi:hypothetical protein
VSFAARFEDPPRVWGIGRVVVGDTIVPWGVSEADVEDEAESLAPRLASLGLGADDLVLIVSLLSQAIHVVPLEKAAGKVGALYSSADATPFDAFRTASLVRQLRAKAVIGVDAGVLDGLVDAGRELAEVFAPVHAVVAADEQAETRLRDAGVDAGRWLKLGATSAFRVPGDDALVYDESRWHVDEEGGELLLTNVVPRLTESRRFRTGTRGRVLEPGRLTVERA